MRKFARFYTYIVILHVHASSNGRFQKDRKEFCLRFEREAKELFHHQKTRTTMVAVQQVVVPAIMSTIPSLVAPMPLWVDICGKLAPALSVGVFMAPIRKYLLDLVGFGII
jgi:hypothetical protein